MLIMIISSMNEFCCHGALFLGQLKHFMNIEYLSNVVAMATLTRFLLEITANLIDKICYYASHMSEPSLNGFKICDFRTFSMCITQHIAECFNVPFVSREPVNSCLQ